MRLILILLLTVPLIEIYVLIQVGSVFGALTTVALIVLTALLGAGLLRWQGFATMQRVKQALARGELPAIEMFEGVILLICGALLLTPGFFTDLIGFIGLLPVLRRSFIIWLISKGMMTRHVNARSKTPGRQEDSQDHRIIEGKFWREDD